MSSKLLLLFTFFLFCLLAHVSSDNDIEDHQTQVVKGANRRLLAYVGITDCGGLCKVRCSRQSRPNLCSRACGTCCMRCKCVPPGTYGNREVCGKCYSDMTTHRNKTKCP